MLLFSQETHSISITQFILYLRSFNSNRLLRQRSPPWMNSCCKQQAQTEANQNSEQIRCQKLPCALPGTREWASTAHFSPLRPHSDSAAQHHTAHFHSLLWSPWSYGLAHHCRLKKQAEKSEPEVLTPTLYSKRTLHTPLLKQAMPATEGGWYFQTQLFQPQSTRNRERCRALNSWAILGRLGNFCPCWEPTPQSLKTSRACNASQENQPIQKTTLLYEMAPGGLSGRNLLLNLWMSQA